MGLRVSMEENKCDLCAKGCSMNDLQCKRGRDLYMRNNTFNQNNYSDASFANSCGCNSVGHERNCKKSSGQMCSEVGGCRGRGRGQHNQKYNYEQGNCGFNQYVDFDRGLSFLVDSCCRHMHRHMPQQGRIRHMIRKCGNITQKELQERLGIKAGSISEILNKMERKGILERREDPCDRRRKRLFLADNASACQEEHVDDFFNVLTEEEQQTLKTLLMKLLGAHNLSSV